MRVVVQRVSRASVSVAGEVVGACESGLMVLVGVAKGDTARDADQLAGKIARLRIFADERGRFDRSVVDIGGDALVVSQFTLLADTRKGNRPSFIEAADPLDAAPLVERLAEALREHGVAVACGRFGAQMEIELHCDGPVTIVLEAP